MKSTLKTSRNIYMEEQTGSEEFPGEELDEAAAEKASNSVRPVRERHSPNRLGYQCRPIQQKALSVLTIPKSTSDNPSVHDAMQANQAEAELWARVIHHELQCLEDKVTWTEIGSGIYGKG